MARKRRRLNAMEGAADAQQTCTQPAPQQRNVLKLAAARQLGLQNGVYLQQQMMQATKDNLLDSLRQAEYHASPHDKAFACAWVAQDTVVVGTKCNSLLSVNVATGAVHSVDLPALPANFMRPPPLHMLHWGPQEPCGIHCIAINQDHTLLATGGRDPNDCAIFRLPTLEPVGTIVGHEDWLFGCTWVTEQHLVTGSRDGLLKLWHCNGSDVITQPLAVSGAHMCKVRDVKFCNITRQVASISTNGAVVVSDAMLQPKQKILLRPAVQEVVCLDIEGHWVVTGSRGNVHHLDTRTNRHQWVIDSPDGQQGVRSVKISEHQLAFGTGAGHIFFYDLRNQQYLVDTLMQRNQGRSKDTLDHYCRTLPFHLKAGTGWLEHNDTYREYFSGKPVDNAVYSLAWDFNRTRLFAAGGPLAFGLRGCYMGLWR